MYLSKREHKCLFIPRFMMVIGGIIFISGCNYMLISGLSNAPVTREVRQTNILNILNSNNSYIFTINFDDCQYVDQQIWNDYSQLNNYLRKNYPTGNNFNVKRYNNAICTISSESTITSSLFLIIFGLLFLFLISCILTCIITRYENISSDVKVLPI